MAEGYGKVQVNRTITFNSKHPNDNVKYRGKVCSLMNYRAAKGLGDIISYNAAVRRGDTSVGGVEELHYFLLEVDNSGTPGSPLFEEEPTMRVFAVEWIKDLRVVKGDRIVVFTVYGIDEGIQSAIEDVIKSTGYYYSVKDI